MGRGGAIAADWPDLVAAARAAEAEGLIKVVGLWSHFACADIPGHPGDRPPARRRSGPRSSRPSGPGSSRRCGTWPTGRPPSNLPQSYFDLVRPGGPVVGLCTTPGGVPDWLRPAMTVRARLIQVKRVPAGTPVSYAHRFETQRDATHRGAPARL